MSDRKTILTHYLRQSGLSFLALTILIFTFVGASKALAGVIGYLAILPVFVLYVLLLASNIWFFSRWAPLFRPVWITALIFIAGFAIWLLFASLPAPNQGPHVPSEEVRWILFILAPWIAEFLSTGLLLTFIPKSHVLETIHRTRFKKRYDGEQVHE